MDATLNRTDWKGPPEIEAAYRAERYRKIRWRVGQRNPLKAKETKPFRALQVCKPTQKLCII